MYRIAFLTIILLGDCWASADGSSLYFTDAYLGSVRRYDIQGSSLEYVIPPDTFSIQSDPMAIDVDPAGQKMYWVDKMNRQVRKANLDGSAIETLYTTPGTGFGPMDIAVANGRIHWTDTPTGSIRSSKLDGSDVQTLIAGLNDPDALGIDAVHGKMYWRDATQTIRSANLDGTGIATAISANTFNTTDIVIDSMAGKIYWTASRAIRRANLDGTAPQLLFQDQQRNFWALALDLDAKKIYWSDVVSTARIGRMNLDGTNRETVITSAQIDPSQIQGLVIVVPEPASQALLLLGLGALVAPTLSRRWARLCRSPSAARFRARERTPERSRGRW
jgi:hypothetical protein